MRKTNDVDYILSLLSHMSVDQSVKSDDNGVTQTVQVRKGVSFVENQRVRPIVKLAPYRTFQEVSQPESEFVFRVYDDRSISLTAADGGMWKMEAIIAFSRIAVTSPRSTAPTSSSSRFWAKLLLSDS